MRKNLKALLFVMLLALAVVIILGPLMPLLAQVVTPPPPVDPCPGGEPCDPDVPITGIEWLLAVGGLFGARKIYKNFRKS